MKKEFKLLNISFWSVLILTLIIPNGKIDNPGMSYGFPFNFLTFYGQGYSNLLIKSISINILIMIIDVIIIYLVIKLALKSYEKLRERDT